MSYLSHSGANVPGSESTRERKFQGAKVPCNFRSRERKFQGTKVPRSESTRERKFHLWYFRSWERKYMGTKVPVTLIKCGMKSKCEAKSLSYRTRNFVCSLLICLLMSNNISRHLLIVQNICSLM